MTDLYKAPPPTTGGYLSHTTRRSWLYLDDPDPGWGVPNTRVNHQLNAKFHLKISCTNHSHDLIQYEKHTVYMLVYWEQWPQKGRSSPNRRKIDRQLDISILITAFFGLLKTTLLLVYKTNTTSRCTTKFKHCPTWLVISDFLVLSVHLMAT